MVTGDDLTPQRHFLVSVGHLISAANFPWERQSAADETPLHRQMK